MTGRENRGGITLRAKFALPLLAAVVAAAALWLASPAPPVAQAQEETADCGVGNPLHGRTQKVVDAILAALPGVDCRIVTAAQLTGITSLAVTGQSLSSLQSNDFAGLSGLEELNLFSNELTELPSGVFAGLSGLTHLGLENNDLTTLPDGAFADLANLEILRLNNNLLTWLPPDAFAGLSALEELYIKSNPQLSCIHAGQFDGLSGLKLLLMDDTQLGNINPAHFTRWSLNQLEHLRLGETLITDSPLAFATYQAVLPALVEGNTYVQNTGDLTDPICQSVERPADCGDGNPLHGRTQKVVDVIVASISAADDCESVTNEQLVRIGRLRLNYKSLSSLRDGDLAGLAGMNTLDLDNNDLTALPADVFNGLSSLQTLRLQSNSLATLPENVFHGLSSLQTLNLYSNSLAALPEDVFEGLSTLQELRLYSNSLAALPEDVFEGLSKLEHLDLHDNSLAALPEDVFEGLSKLEQLNLNNNSLATLPEDVFDGLSRLVALHLNDNSLTALPEDVFDGLPRLIGLHLHSNLLAALPEDVFNGPSVLEFLYLNQNSLEWLAPGLFDGLSLLQDLQLNGNSSLACIHPGQFDGLSKLEILHLQGTKLGNIAPAPASRWGLNSLEELRFGDTLISNSALSFADYQAVFPALVESRTRVTSTAVLSDPICGSITADADGSYDGTVRVRLEHTRVYPNRAQDTGNDGDGFCGAATGEDRRKLWRWQRSDDGVAWTDLPSARQPKDYGARAEGECSFHYTPHSDDNEKYLRAYVPVDTAGVGENNYHSAAYGPLNLRP